VDRLGSFFDVIHQDPVISQVKLIAEPWDLGGYQVGNFPHLWSEWNGRYRDCARDYWRGADRTLAEFAYRLTGSSDLYGQGGKRRASTTSPGSAPTDRRWARRTGARASPSRWNGEAIPSPDAEGNRIVDDSFLLLFNAHFEPLPLRLPEGPWGRRFRKVLDTAEELPREGGEFEAGAEVRAEARSLVVLRRVG
jgi:pullulanase/glycogen debranching enzyme